MDQQTKEALDRAASAMKETVKSDMSHVKGALFKNPLVVGILVLAAYAIARDLSVIIVAALVGVIVLIARSVKPKDAVTITKAAAVTTAESVKNLAKRGRDKEESAPKEVAKEEKK